MLHCLLHRITFLRLLLLCACSLTACIASNDVEVIETPSTATHDRSSWVDDAVIYEIFVRNFTPEGTFRAIIPRLPELQALGVTTLWLMPIHPIGEARRKGTLGSPYAGRDYFSVNPDFGTEEDFRALVDAVHEAGMYLLIDLVANHTAWDHAWLAEHPDWYTRAAGGRITHPPGTDWTDVADLDYDHEELRAEMTRVMRHWVEAFGIDGYRCDVAELVPLDFWEAAIREVRTIKPVMMLAEGEDPALHGHGFDLTYSWRLYGTLKEVWDGAPASALVDVLAEQQAAFPEDALRLRFTTNHDETAWDDPPIILFGGPEGERAASVLTLLLPGVPLIYNGQEVGSDVRLPLFEKMHIDWSQHPEMRTFYERLLGLRNGHEALRRGSLNLLALLSEDVLVYERAAGDERFLIAVNVRDRSAATALPDTFRTSTFTDALTGSPHDADTLALPPYGYRILRID